MNLAYKLCLCMNIILFKDILKITIFLVYFFPVLTLNKAKEAQKFLKNGSKMQL